MKRADKKCQMQLSFGMIFSIFLIIIFLALAFYAIKKVLETSEWVKIRGEINRLQEDVNEVYRSSAGNFETPGDYKFSGKIKQVCFIDYGCGTANCRRGNGNADVYETMEVYFDGKENLFFYPEYSSNGVNAVEIKNIDINEITKTNNPYCIENEDGDGVQVYLKKNEGNPLVIIEKA